MPLKLVPPRKARSKNWSIRGTYLGVPIDRSAKTSRKQIAARELRKIETEIERGRLTPTKGPTFAGAVIAYIKGGGEKRYLDTLLEYFGTWLLTDITQAAVDEAAGILYPPGISAGPTPHNATINRQIHTPVSAVMAAGRLPIRFKRPKQPTGRVVWLEPPEAGVWLDSCPDKLRRLSVFLLYTGVRITEAVDLEGGQVSPAHALAYIGKTKSGEPRAVHLPPPVIAELQQMTLTRGARVFGYRDRWQVYDDWNPLRDELNFPTWWTPHACCHTWATWMRRYSGLDLRGLLGTGRWSDLKSVLRYQHVNTTEESRAADRLPNLQSVENPWSHTKKLDKSIA